MQQSESVTELAKGLVAMQGKLESVARSSEGYNYKFADLAACWDSVRKPMTDSGLALVQTTRPAERGENVMITTLMHTSGEWIRGEMLIAPIKNEPQALGSSLSYARRYGMMAILGISAVGADDDGAAASADGNTKSAAKPKAKATPQVRPPAHEPDKKARDHFRELFRECVEQGISTKDLATLNDDDSVEVIRAAYKANRALLDAVTKQPELT